MTEREIFGAALQLDDTDSRQNYLANVCGADRALRQRVECLLQAYGRAGDFLQRPAVARSIPGTSSPVPGESPGDRLGPYKLLEQIGEGGMGVVYMAEQQEPLRRKVALKIIKPGMDSKQVVVRFEAERQALAL